LLRAQSQKIAFWCSYRVITVVEKIPADPFSRFVALSKAADENGTGSVFEACAIAHQLSSGIHGH
jgi:hypothetical protein